MRSILASSKRFDLMINSNRGDNDLIVCRIVANFLIQIEESEQLIDFSTVKVTCYY